MHRRALVLLALAALCAALLPSLASARTSRPFESSFGAFASGHPKALAVDQSNGDVYVTSADRVVARFDAAGAPRNFTAGPDAGTNTLTGFGTPVIGLAIDNSGGPLNGTLYVAQQAPPGGVLGQVRVFATTGASLGSITGAGTGTPFNSGNNLCAVAVDQANGTVYMGTIGTIWRYAPTSPAGSIDDGDFAVTGISPRPLEFTPLCAVAADAGNVYAGQGTLRKFSAADFAASPPEVEGLVIEGLLAGLNQGVRAVAVDPKTGDVYANEGNRVVVFDSAGNRLYYFGQNAYTAAASAAIAVKSAASGPAAKVYLADPRSGGREVDVYGLPEGVLSYTYPPVASFGSDGTAATSFNGSTLLNLGFDQAQRRLYAVDRNVPGIYGFNAAAPPAFPPLAGFSPLTTSAASSGFDSHGFAVDNSGLGSAGNLYLGSVSTDLLHGWDSTGAALGGAFPVDPAVSPGAPDGSPKNLCGAGVDTAGNVWVSNVATSRILKYSSAGASLAGTTDTSAQGRPCSLAFDTNDDLYVVMQSGGGVWRYTAASSYTAATKVAASSAPVVGIAVDPSTHDLYLAHSESICFDCPLANWVDVYDSAGNLFDEFQAPVASAWLRGIAVDATNHHIYLADYANAKIHAFAPGTLFPEAETKPATSIDNTTATLNGEVGPQSLALSDCHFEYVTEAAFQASGFGDLSSGGGAPCTPPPGSIPQDPDHHPVSAAVSGLTRNTTYRFRLSAANANGTTVADPVSLTTTGPPEVETTGAPIRSATTAQLSGRVNPRGAATTYHFEYGTEGPCDFSSCTATASQPAASGQLIRFAQQEVTGLSPNTTYHYRIVAENGNPDGPASGDDMTVTTPASDAPLSHGHFPGPPNSDRAWEQVNTPNTGGNPVVGGYGFSVDGNRALYQIAGGTPISDTGSLFGIYFAQRPAGEHPTSSWLSQSITPPRAQLAGANWSPPAATDDLSAVVARNLLDAAGPSRLFAMQPGGAATLLHEDSNNDFDTIAASDDGSRVVGTLRGAPDPDYPSATGFQLYDLSAGAAELIGFLPGGGVPGCDAAIAPGPGGGMPLRASRWLSPDGALAYFNCGGEIYLRDIPAGETKLVSKDACTARFIKATPGAAFLWCGSGAGKEGDVYRYDVGADSLGCVTCSIPAPGADIAVNLGNGGRTDNVIAVAPDGSRVYFKSPNVLVPGAAVNGIYRIEVDSGDLAYVAGIGGSNVGEVAQNSQAISVDGSVLVFGSAEPSLNPLGGEQTNAGTLQYYRYDDTDRSLICLSCPLDGGAPAGNVDGSLLDFGSENQTVGGATPLSDDGETFAFVTKTALVNADQNTPGPGADPEAGADVYEWRDGRLLLVTDGLTSWPQGSPPRLEGMSASGNDVYFIASAQYTQDAIDSYYRLYDARIGGGIAFPAETPPCPLEVCQGTPRGRPSLEAPSTDTVLGAGNVRTPGAKPSRPRRCPKGKRKVRRAGKTRCVAKKRKHAKHKRRAQR